MLAPSLREWLAEGHLAWFVLDAVEAMISASSMRPIARTATVGPRTIRR